VRTAFRLITLLALGLTLGLGATAVAAQPLDAASTEALAAVLRLLQDPAARGAVIAGHPEAAAMDRNIQALMGSPALTQEFYELAAQVFTDLVQGSGGDLGRMQRSLADGQRDPTGFAAFLSPATLQHLRDLSGRVSDLRR
jgi:hypothetical protein